MGFHLSASTTEIIAAIAAIIAAAATPARVGE
jgi:hypothetical protein